MSAARAIDAVREKLRVDGFTAAQLEGLHRALPPRGARSSDEINVAIAIAMAYRDVLRPGYAWVPCRKLAAELARHVGPDGRYVAALGQPLDLVSTLSDVITGELERRHSCDLFELWEADGGDVARDADTDAYTRFMVAEIERRCSSGDRKYCEHNEQ